MELNNKKIVLIDDDVIVNKVNKFLIDSTGFFETIEAKTAPQEALNYFEELIKIKAELPGFVLVDISMPEIDGFEFIDLLDELFEDYEIEELPAFVILSATNFKRDYEQFDKTPIVKKFLSKPLDKDEFENVLKELEFI